MVTIRTTDEPWALYGGYNWEVVDEYSETKNFFHTWEEAIDYLATLNY